MDDWGKGLKRMAVPGGYIYVRNECTYAGWLKQKPVRKLCQNSANTGACRVADPRIREGSAVAPDGITSEAGSRWLGMPAATLASIFSRRRVGRVPAASEPGSTDVKPSVSLRAHSWARHLTSWRLPPGARRPSPRPPSRPHVGCTASLPLPHTGGSAPSRRVALHHWLARYRRLLGSANTRYARLRRLGTRRSRRCVPTVHIKSARYAGAAVARRCHDSRKHLCYGPPRGGVYMRTACRTLSSRANQTMHKHPGCVQQPL